MFNKIRIHFKYKSAGCKCSFNANSRVRIQCKKAVNFKEETIEAIRLKYKLQQLDVFMAYRDNQVCISSEIFPRRSKYIDEDFEGLIIRAVTSNGMVVVGEKEFSVPPLVHMCVKCQIVVSTQLDNRSVLSDSIAETLDKYVGSVIEDKICDNLLERIDV